MDFEQNSGKFDPAHVPERGDKLRPDDTKRPIVWPPVRQYPKLMLNETPEDWDTLEEFMEWYIKAGKPMLIPWDSGTIQTDDATAICIFRMGRYQVELYIIHPGFDIPPHSHPNMEVIAMTLGGGIVCGPAQTKFNVSSDFGRVAKIKNGQWHGGDETKSGIGFAILSFEKFLNGTTPCSAAIQWRGPTAGPIHDKLIAKHQAE